MTSYREQRERETSNREQREILPIENRERLQIENRERLQIENRERETSNVTVYGKTGHNAACVNIEKRSINFLKMYCFKPTVGNG